MKIISTKAELLDKVNIALKAVPAKTTMPILECVLIEATDNGITLTTNDLEMGIETVLEGNIEEPGKVALDAKMFSEIIKKMPNNDIAISVDDKFTATITCEKSKFQIPGREGNDFAKLPEVKKNTPVVLSQFALKDMVLKTVFATSVKDANKMMMAEYFEIEGNTFKICALDGHRIAIRKTELLTSYDRTTAIVPAKTLNEVAKILSGEVNDTVNIYITNNHVVFELNDATIVSRVIEGEYFKVMQMLNNNYSTKVTVNRKEFADCVDRASLFISEGNKKPIIATIANQKLDIRIESARGKMHEDLNIAATGDDLQIGLNPKFVTDVLKAIDDEMVDIYMTNKKSPCIIKNNDESYIYLVLPVAF